MSNRFGPRTRQNGLVPASLVKNWMAQNGVLKSVQRATITLSAIQTTNTATITAVATANAYVVCLGNTSEAPAASQGGEAYARLVLTNSTTVTATRLSAGSIATVSFEVVEFQFGFVKSVQPFSVTIGNGSATGTAAITSVTTGKSFIAPGGYTSNDAVGLAQDLRASMAMTSATQITGTRVGTSGEIVMAGTVVEMK